MPNVRFIVDTRLCVGTMDTMNNTNTIATDLANLLVAAAREAWEAAQVKTNSNWGFTTEPEVTGELALAHHNANHNPASIWDMSGSPALYGAIREELVAQDRYCDAVERRRLRDEGRRIARTAAAAGQLALGL